ncbi:glycosyltransferase [Candidatus Latescibacterota bacterium]
MCGGLIDKNPPVENEMTLSVIIPVHGRPELLIRCLQSLKQDLQGHVDVEYSVCVVDDGSNLDEKLIRKQSDIDYPLAWHTQAVNRGRSAARNEGIRATSGDIVVFLDSDMEARPGFLKAHHSCHKEHPKTAVIGTIHWPKGGGFLRYIGSRGVLKLKSGEPVPPWYFVTGNASVMRADLPGDSPFDEQSPAWGGEDQDLGLRLDARGVSFMHAFGAESYHNFHGTLVQHLQRTGLYGREALPGLVERHPTLRKAVHLDFLETLTGRLAVSAPVYYPVYGIVRLLDALPLPSRLYDYLTFAAYGRGWLERTRS